MSSITVKGHTEHVGPTTIIIDGRVNIHTPVSEHAAAARNICGRLIASLPSGTWNRLLRDMLEQQIITGGNTEETKNILRQAYHAMGEITREVPQDKPRV